MPARAIRRQRALALTLLTAILLAGCAAQAPEPTASPAAPTGAATIEVEFTGTLESFSLSEWQVDGRVLQVTQQSEVRGPVQPGERVRVVARLDAAGGLTALSMEAVTAPATPAAAPSTPAGSATPAGTPAGEIEFFGRVEALAADQWIIDGRVVRITAATEIRGAISVGDRVKVHAQSGPDGVLVAREIERRDN